MQKKLLHSQIYRLRRLIYNIVTPVRNKIWRRQCKYRDFTIISQDCIGGIIYHRLKMKFLSPTINLLFLGANFCKLAEHPAFYFSHNAEAVDPAHSPYPECPTIRIVDIYAKCPHNPSAEDAAKCWNRRRTRANLNHAVIIANTWDLLGDAALVGQLESVPLPKIIFAVNSKQYHGDDFLYLGKKFRQTNIDQPPRPLLKAGTFDNRVRLFEKEFRFYKLLARKLRK